VKIGRGAEKWHLLEIKRRDEEEINVNQI